jgi:hypothetical protein
MSSEPETIACMGLPEPDGGLPFVLLAIREQKAVLVLGTTGSGEPESIEHLVTDPTHGREILNTAKRHHKLLSLPFHVALHFVEKSFGGVDPAGWEGLLSTLEDGSLNAARLLDPLRGFPEQLDPRTRIESILEEEGGISFGIDEAVVETVFEDLMGVVNSPIIQREEGRRRRLAQIIDQASDRALDKGCRARWLLTLQAVSWMGREQGWEGVWQACWHTSLALAQDRKGSEIPFVRVWVERQLAMTIHTAMSMMGPGSLAERIALAKEDLEH